MTTKKTTPGKGPAKPTTSAGPKATSTAPKATSAAPKATSTSGPKKPYATIDLKATEVKNQTGGNGKPGPSGKTGEGVAKTSGATPSAKAGTSASATATTKPVDTKTDASAKTGTVAAGVKTASAKEDATGKTDKRPAQQSNKKRGGSGIGSMISHMAAGVVGGFLALVGGQQIAPQLEQFGIHVPSGQVETSPVTVAMEQRLASLEVANSTRASSSTDTEALEAQINAAEAKLAELDSVVATVGALTDRQERLVMEVAAVEAAATSGGDVGTVGDRVAGLEAQLGALVAAAGQDDGGSGIANIAAITGRLVDLETNVNNQMAALRDSVGTDIESRIATISESSAAAKLGTTRNDRKVATLTTDTARLTQRLEALKADTERLTENIRVAQESSAKTTSAIEAFKGDVKKTVAGLATHKDVGTAVSAVSARIETLKESVGGVVRAESDRKANAQRIVLSLELGNLKRALDRGTAYGDELEDVRKAAGETLDLSKLSAFEDTGVPTLANLKSSFRPVANAIIDAAQAPVDGNVFDQMMAGARSIVRVRKTTHDEDDTSVEAIVGRMESALSKGDLDLLTKTAQTLPEKTSGPAQAWLGKVEARRSVAVALREIEGQLKASLSGTGTAEDTIPAPTQAN